MPDYYGFEENPFLRRASRLFESNSGMNAYNRMVQQGSARIARGQSDTIERLREMIGRNPSLLKELVSEITERSAEEHSALSTAASKMLLSANLGEVGRLTDVGLASERTRLERDRMAEARKIHSRDWLSLVSNILGGGLSAGGRIIGASISAKGKRELKEMLDD